MQASAGSSGQPSAAGAGADTCKLCETYATPQQAGSIRASELEALSGLTASRTQPGIFYAHNDHNRPVVYALDLQGNLHLRITLSGAQSTDIEDIAVGPCPSGSCVYLADVGDNASQRNEYAVLRFPEPTVPAAPGSESATSSFERFAFRYPDGKHNAEGLMVGPNGRIYIVTKRAEGGPSHVYRLPDPPATSGVNEAVSLMELPIPMAGDEAASAASAHPCGLGFVVRTYNRIYEFRSPSSDFEAALGVTPVVIAMPDERQSEGITYSADGRSVISSGEGRSAPIMETGCAAP